MKKVKKNKMKKISKPAKRMKAPAKIKSAKQLPLPRQSTSARLIGDTAKGPVIKTVESPEALKTKGVEQLVALGKEKGFLTYDDINRLLPSHITSSDDIEDR